MAFIYLIRHGTNDYLTQGRLAGRTPGVHLNDKGRAEAELLAKELTKCNIRHLFSSPLDRARETAEPIAKLLNLKIQSSDALLEINFADWAGQKFEDLHKNDEAWRQWNQYRSGGKVPGGEMFLEVQHRMVRQIEDIRRQCPHENTAVVSHGDPLRSVIQYYMGMSLDLYHRLEISPASYTVLELHDYGARLHAMNVTSHLASIGSSTICR